MRVVLDANALMMPFEYGINLDSELERLVGEADIYVPSCVIGEIEKLSKRRWEAKAALKLLKKYKICETNCMGDEGVVDCGERMRAIVVTNDEGLQQKLRKKGIRIIYLSNYHLVIEND